MVRSCLKKNIYLSTFLLLASILLSIYIATVVNAQEEVPRVLKVDVSSTTVYRGYSFDSYVQTSLYTAYIVVDKLSETNIRCLKDFSGHVFIEGLTMKNEIINKEIGSCGIERKEITYIISDLKNYRVYILSKDPYNIFNLRFYNDGSIYLSPRDNSSFFIAIQGMFITSLILLNMPAYIKNRSYRKRVRKRKI